MTDVFATLGALGAVPAILGVNANGGYNALEMGAQLGGVPVDAATSFIGSSVHLIVHLESAGGDVRVTEVSEISSGMVTAKFSWDGSDFVAS